MNWLFIGFSLSLFVTVVLVIGGVSLWWQQHHSVAVRRLEQRLQALSAGGHVSNVQLSIMKERLISQSPMLTRWLQRLPRVSALDRLLLQAGSSWSVSKMLGVTVGLTLSVGAMLALLDANAWFCIAGMIIAIITPSSHVLRQRTQRLRKIETQLPDGADLIARALRAGHAFSSALGMAGDEIAEPLGGEFKLTFEEINYGVPINDAMLNLASRVPVKDLRYFIIAVLIQREAGGNLAEILQNIGQIIRKRLKLLGKVRVLSAEGRLSAWVLSLLPFCIAGAVFILNPEFMAVLWQDPLGFHLMIGSLTMVFIGVLWMRKIIRIHI